MRSRLSVRRPHIRVQLINRRKNLGKLARSQRRQFQQWIQSAVLPDPIAEKRQQVFADLALATQENNQADDAEKQQKKRDKKKAKKQDSKAEEAKRIVEQKKAAEREARKAEADAKQKAAEEEEYKKWKADQERIQREISKKEEEAKQLKEQHKKAVKAEKKNKSKKESESSAAAVEEHVEVKKVNHTEKSPEPPTPTNTPAEPADHEPHKETAKKNKKNKKASESEKVAEPVVEEHKEVHVESGSSKKNKKSKKHSESGNETVAVETPQQGNTEEEVIQKTEVSKSESSGRPTADNLDFLDFVTPKNAEPEAIVTESVNVQEQTPVTHEDEEGSNKKNKNKNKKNKNKKHSESESAAPAQQNASEETFEKKTVAEQASEAPKIEEPAKQAVSVKPTADNLDFLDFVTPKKDASDDVQAAAHEEHVQVPQQEEKSDEHIEKSNSSPQPIAGSLDFLDFVTPKADEPEIVETEETYSLNSQEEQPLVSKNDEDKKTDSTENAVPSPILNAGNESENVEQQNSPVAETADNQTPVVVHEETKTSEKKNKNKKNKTKKHSESESAVQEVRKEFNEEDTVVPLNEESTEKSAANSTDNVEQVSVVSAETEIISTDAQSEDSPVVHHEEEKHSEKKNKNKKNKNKKHSESESTVSLQEEAHVKNVVASPNEEVNDSPAENEGHSETPTEPAKPTTDDFDFLDFVTLKKDSSDEANASRPVAAEPQEQISPVEAHNEIKTNEHSEKPIASVKPTVDDLDFLDFVTPKQDRPDDDSASKPTDAELQEHHSSVEAHDEKKTSGKKNKKNKNKKHSESESVAHAQEEVHGNQSVASPNEQSADSIKTREHSEKPAASVKTTADDLDFLDFVIPKQNRSDDVSASKPADIESHEKHSSVEAHDENKTSDKKNKNKKNKSKKHSESESPVVDAQEEVQEKQTVASLNEQSKTNELPVEQVGSEKSTGDDFDFLDFVTPKKDSFEHVEATQAVNVEHVEPSDPENTENASGNKKSKKNKSKKHSESEPVSHGSAEKQISEEKHEVEESTKKPAFSSRPTADDLDFLDFVTPKKDQSGTAETAPVETAPVEAVKSESPVSAHEEKSDKKKNKKNKNKKHSESDSNAAVAHHASSEETIEKNTVISSTEQPNETQKSDTDHVAAAHEESHSPVDAHDQDKASGKKKNKKNKNKKHSESESAAPTHNDASTEEVVEKKIVTPEEEPAVESNKKPAFSARPTADNLDFLDFVTPKKDESDVVESSPTAAVETEKASSPTAAHEEASGKKKNKKNKNKKHSESESASNVHVEVSEPVVEKKIITPEEELAAERAEAAAVAEQKKVEADREASPVETESSGKKKNKKNKNKKHSESESVAPAAAPAAVQQTEVEETFEKKIVTPSNEQSSESSKDKKNKKNKKKGSGHSESKEIVIPESEPQPEPKFVEIPSNDTNEAGKGSPGSDKENTTHASVNGGSNVTEHGTGNDKKNKKKNKKNKNSNSISEKDHQIITDLDNEAQLDQLADDEVGAITGGASQSSPIQVYEVSSTEGNVNGTNVEKTTTIQITNEVDRSNLSPTQFQKNVEKLVQATLAKHEIVENDPAVKIQIDAQLIRMAQKKAPAVVIEHKNYIKPLPMELHISRPSTPSRDRLYKLLPKDILFCAGLIDTHGENYAAMAKDPRNTFLETSRSLQRKIRIFKDSPHFQTYLNAKEDGKSLEEAIAAEEGLTH